jgi:hypothetical protein
MNFSSAAPGLSVWISSRLSRHAMRVISGIVWLMA